MGPGPLAALAEPGTKSSEKGPSTQYIPNSGAPFSMGLGQLTSFPQLSSAYCLLAAMLPNNNAASRISSASLHRQMAAKLPLRSTASFYSIIIWLWATGYHRVSRKCAVMLGAFTRDAW